MAQGRFTKFNPTAAKNTKSKAFTYKVRLRIRDKYIEINIWRHYLEE